LINQLSSSILENTDSINYKFEVLLSLKLEIVKHWNLIL